MRILVVGAGGVGAAIASIAARRPTFEQIVIADIDAARSQRAAQHAASDRVVGTRVDAGERADIVELARSCRADVIVNACDPRFNPPIFEAAFAAGCHYVDLAMHMSTPHPTDPYHQIGVLLGHDQFAASDAWADRDLLALVGMGVEPGFSDVVARYASDHLFTTIDEIGVRDGGDLVVEGFAFAPTFSIWTTIEECLNPPIVYERGRGWFTTAPFSEPEAFTFPDGIGTMRCVNVEHEEVVLMPRWLDPGRVTFKYGLGDEFLDVLAMLHKLGLDSTRPVDVRGTAVSPRDVVAAVLPNPALLGDRMRGRTCAGSLVTGTGVDGRPRCTYLYQIVDNEWTMREYGHQAVVWQTALHPVIALELLGTGEWKDVGVRGPEAFRADPFLALVAEHGATWAIDERAVR
ncbi:MAG: Saccharopine dehydrogenase [Ilumatobacteraceae bacterium]|nr:Saccharopine dehydrogenase [Ilumatobacteraceae bacterium]